MMEMKWWAFPQNNSGGSFIHDPDEGIGHWVFIEAAKEDEAIERALDIGLYFNGCDDGRDCPCCGDRWSEPCGEGAPVPTIYGETVRPVAEGENPWSEWGLPSYMHPLNGPFAAVVKDARNA